MDYILSTDHSLFQNFSIWDPRHNMDHQLILECLRGANLRENLCYLRFHMRKAAVTGGHSIFTLRRAVPNPPEHEYTHNWCGDLGGDPYNWESTGGLPSQGGVTDHREEIAEKSRWVMGLTPTGEDHARNGTGGYRYTYLQA